jgi:predicted nuclease of predicted toxin-antitoxin system
VTLLADHDVWAGTIELLTSEGHDVTTASDLDLERAPDRVLLQKATARNRLLLTRDRDFGRLVFARGKPAGVLYLRITPSTQEIVHKELLRVLKNHSHDELRSAFTVVEPGQHRMRHLS